MPTPLIRFLTISFFAAFVLIVASPASAQDSTAAPGLFDSNFDGPLDPHRFMIRLRGIGVVPDEDASVAVLGGNVRMDNDIVPELDFTYFLTDHFAAELILASSKHSVTATGGGGIPLGSVRTLPPTLTLQYHPWPEEQFRPYIGAGINYTHYFDEQTSGAIANIDYDDTFGPALQAGIDIGLDDHWAINFDVKKIWMNTDVTVNSGSGIVADVDIDPWVFGFGIAYRF